MVRHMQGTWLAWDDQAGLTLEEKPTMNLLWMMALTIRRGRTAVMTRVNSHLWQSVRT